MESNEKDKELLAILEHCLWFGRIHTVAGVKYEYTHEEILNKLETYLNTNYKMKHSPMGNTRQAGNIVSLVADLLDFVNEIANDPYDRVSPVLQERAKKLLKRQPSK